MDWNLPVGLYNAVCAKSLQLCLTLCDPRDYSPPGSSVHGILQVRKLEWVAMPSSRGSSDPGTEPASPALQADSLPLSHHLGSPSWQNLRKRIWRVSFSSVQLGGTRRLTLSCNRPYLQRSRCSSRKPLPAQALAAPPPPAPAPGPATGLPGRFCGFTCPCASCEWNHGMLVLGVSLVSLSGVLMLPRSALALHAPALLLHGRVSSGNPWGWWPCFLDFHPHVCSCPRGRLPRTGVLQQQRPIFPSPLESASPG